MDIKSKIKNLPPQEIKGFEEFIDEHKDDATGQKTTKKEGSFESYNFLEKDSKRLGKIKDLMSQKIPFIQSHDQSHKLKEDQRIDLELMKDQLHDLFSQESSGFQKSMSEVFNSYFGKK